MCLYHYSSNEKAFSILSGHSIRLNDIAKSNDYRELELLHPQLLYTIHKRYKENPFAFKYEGKTGIEALTELVVVTKELLDAEFDKGGFSNFVACFSEEKDCLSQWRGYADDGQGCCIGFDKKSLQQLCNSANGVLRLEKVIYLTEKDLADYINEAASIHLKGLKDLRSWIVDEITKDDENPETDSFLGFNFYGAIEHTYSDSLKFKSCAFSEEKEWRLFLTNQAYKNPDWVYSDSDEKMIGPHLFAETVQYLNNRIDFRVTPNDIIPFCPLHFEEFETSPIKEMILGPRNKIRMSDIELFLKKYCYDGIDIQFSKISYR